MTDVKVGQVWADNDWRSQGRTVRIVAIGVQRATVEVLTVVGGAPARNPRQTRVRLARFKPTSTGYRLIEEAM